MASGDAVDKPNGEPNPPAMLASELVACVMQQSGMPAVLQATLTDLVAAQQAEAELALSESNAK